MRGQGRERLLLMHRLGAVEVCACEVVLARKGTVEIECVRLRCKRLMYA